MGWRFFILILEDPFPDWFRLPTYVWILEWASVSCTHSNDWGNPEVGQAAEEQRSKFPTSPVHILWILELKSRGHLRPADFEDGFSQEAQWGPLRRMLMPR